MTAIFVWARVTVFSGARQQNFAGAGLWRDFFLKKCTSKIYDAIMQVLSPPYVSGGNSGGCGNDHRKVTTMTMKRTTMADADADANGPQQLQQQKHLLQ